MTSNLPLVRLSAINPLFLDLKRRGLDVASLLREYELPTNVPASTDLFVASDSIYELVERCGELSNDRYFGFRVGNALDLMKWEPIADAATKAKTVGELLTLFAIYSRDHSTATRFFIRTDGERSTFGLERVKRPPVLPAHNDAFYMGFMVRLLKHATRDDWRTAEVLFRVADPNAIPADSDVFRVARGDRAGVRITFPSTWLFRPFEGTQFKASFEKEQVDQMPRSLLDSLQIALRPHLHDLDLNADKAAKICGHNRRRLGRELRSLGTTLTKEIRNLRSEKAARALVDSDQSIAEIAETVGFTDPTVFSRAFKNWTGQSPRDYRRTHKAPV